MLCVAEASTKSQFFKRLYGKTILLMRTQEIKDDRLFYFNIS